MNKETLKQQLEQLTVHEKEYLQHLASDHLERYGEMKMVSEKPVYHMTKTKSPGQKHDFILVKKHTRFQNWPIHTHDFVELNYVYCGKCCQIVNEKTITLTKGQMILLDSDVRHGFQPLGKEDIIIDIILDKAYLNSHFFNRFSSEQILTRFFIQSITSGVSHSSYMVFQSQNSQRLQTLMELFLCEWFDPSVMFKDMIEGLLATIIAELVNVYQLSTQAQNADYTSQVIPMLNYIEKHFRDCTLSQLAEQFHLNKNYLSNLLKKHTGCSYQELVNEQRLNYAMTLLKNSNLPISEIAVQSGFSNLHFFYQKFEARYHMPPGMFRQKQVIS